MFVVLLAVDRYCAMCRSHWCARYRLVNKLMKNKPELFSLTIIKKTKQKTSKFNNLRNYRTAIALSLCAWIFAAASASPLYIFAEVAFLRLRSIEKVHKLCIAKWPNSDVARW